MYEHMMYAADIINGIERRCDFQGPRRVLPFCGGSAMKNMVTLLDTW